jgi:hypothetical protein
MSTKTLLKFGVAFGLLAIVLIFLGVNFVTSAKAFSSAKGSIVDASLIQIQSPDINTGDEPSLSPWPNIAGQIQSPDITPGDKPYLSP